MQVLVINCGSSSLKYQLRDMETESVRAAGVVERIGDAQGIITHTSAPDSDNPAKQTDELPIPDHVAAMKLMVDRLLNGVIDSLDDIDAIGHRVVQGGESFTTPVLVDDEAVETIRANIPLAPLHGSNLTGIEQARAIFGDTPNVAVFDTEFHQTIPRHAYMYPLPMRFYDDLRIRKYGFHGTSHKFVSRATAAHMGKAPSEVNLITLHLGNGCSMDAVKGGVCVETTMGLTPLAGLMMGTRCGDIDPAILPYLAQNADLSIEEIDRILNKESGLSGICGMNDMRDIHAAREQGDEKAQLAFEMFAYRARKTVGAFLAVLGTVDGIVFTAGIGENDADVREAVCAGLEPLGIRLDRKKNAVRAPGIRDIHEDDSPVKIMIVPTNEELEIARSTVDIVTKQLS